MIYIHFDTKNELNELILDSVKLKIIKCELITENSELNLICSDWNKLDSKIIKDWSINVASNNLRYDADTSEDLDYLHSTIKCMYNHANKGIIILLTSTHSKVQDGLINYNPGDLLNWAQQTFGYSAIDHTVSNDGFILLIYKTQITDGKN